MEGVFGNGCGHQRSSPTTSGWLALMDYDLGYFDLIRSCWTAGQIPSAKVLAM